MEGILTIQPFGIKAPCSSEKTLLECLTEAGVKLAGVCGGKGTCGKCIVQLIDGELRDGEGKEQIALRPPADDGDDLFYACTVYPRGDCTVYVPETFLSGKLQTQTDYGGTEQFSYTEPAVEIYTVNLPPPNLSDHRSDARRLCDALFREYGTKIDGIDWKVLSVASRIIREHDWTVSVAVYGHEVIRIASPDASYAVLGVDIGTTKCALFLLDPRSGKKIDALGVLNPQASYGADVVSRIGNTVEQPRLRDTLRNMLVEEINARCTELCARNALSPEDIVLSVFVGNTAMHHLFLGLEVEQLVNAPYVPAATDFCTVKSRELDLRCSSGGYALCLPNIAGYVGADHVAMLLAAEADRNRNNVLYIDIGTNTEMCLATSKKIYTLSAPSGPAFEGAHIRSGMRAVPGAIDTFLIDTEGRFHYTTIEKGKPKGICGSGILDIMAQIYLHAIVDWRGRLQDHERVFLYEGTKQLEIVPAEESDTGQGIFITQKDIREFQLAMGAIASGIHVLVETTALSLHDISEIVIAGAFGTYINVQNALFLGMFPFPREISVRQIGNAAGAGACMVALDKSVRNRIDAMCAELEYIELVNAPGFKKTYARATYFGNEFIGREDLKEGGGGD